MKFYKMFPILFVWLPLTTLLCLLVDKIFAIQSFAPPLSKTIAPLSTELPLQRSLEPSMAAPLGSRVPTPLSLNQKVYYVAPNGDDTNPGTAERPWRTIQKAADTLVAGESVYIRQGIYSERIRPQNSGKPGKEISYLAYPGESVTVDGREVDLPDDLAGLIEISHQQSIRIGGLHVVNSGPYADNAGILIIHSEHIAIENNITFNTASSGIGVWHSREVLISGNTVEQGGVRGGQECITVAGSSGFEVRSNLVVDCQKEGIDAKDGSSDGIITQNVVERPRAVGIYVDAWDKPTHDILVSRNRVFDSVESNGFALASEMGGLLANVRLENNLAYHNHTYGIEVSACCSADHPMEGVVIINNTLYGNGVGWGGGIIQDNPQAQNVVIRNNLVSQNLTFQIAVVAGALVDSVVVDHNLIDGYRGYEDEVYGLDYLEGDAGFFNLTTLDFHLSPTSAAIDQGSPVDAPTTDFEGDPRPSGNGYDIGADERQWAVYLPLIKNWAMLVWGYLCPCKSCRTTPRSCPTERR
ncbi:MAG: right-handed parallel beta-helix repeat-containing protein [Anaerolineales bacterium]